MRNRVYIALAVVLGILAGVIGWQVLRLREPVYQGTRLSIWLEQCEWSARGETGPKAKSKKGAEMAIRQIGTNAIPILLEWLRHKDLSEVLKASHLWGPIQPQKCVKVHCHERESPWNQGFSFSITYKLVRFRERGGGLSVLTFFHANRNASR